MNSNTTIYQKQVQRNQGLISDLGQQKIRNATVTIAGVGGDGGLLAERLVRFGINNLILLDPENFDFSNLNRQFASNASSIGLNKAEAVARELLNINPAASIKVFKEGLTRDNVSEIVEQSDVLVDEIEFSLPDISVMLHRESRKQGKPVFMGANIGWGASFFYFTPQSMTFEEFFSFDPEENAIDTLAYLPSKPDYISDELLEGVLTGKIEVPAIASSVALVAAVMSTDIILYLAQEREPVAVPEFKHLDLFELAPTTTRRHYHENANA